MSLRFFIHTGEAPALPAYKIGHESHFHLPLANLESKTAKFMYTEPVNED
jgi:hypothetical protein